MFLFYFYCNVNVVITFFVKRLQKMRNIVSALVSNVYAIFVSANVYSLQ